MALAVLVIAGAFNPASSVSAAPPPPCTPPPPPGAGTRLYHVFATLPPSAPAAAQAVCISVPGALSLNTGAVTQAPAVCPPAVTGAGALAVSNFVWADWGFPCVAPGATVVLQFFGAPGLIPLGRVTGAATWVNAAGAPMIGDATVWPDLCPTSPPGIGGAPLVVAAAAPVGGPYDGACEVISPAAGGLHSPTVLVSPPGCGVNYDGAALSQVWDDFTTLCANAGDVLIIQVFGPPGLVGPCAGCVTWFDGAVGGNATISPFGFVNPGAGRPCIQDHKDDTNGDGYSNADQMTPPGMPTCTGAFPPMGGLGTDPFASCPGRNLGGTPAQMAAAMKAKADVDLDGQITIIDLSIVAGHFLESANPADATDVHWEYDQDGDGQMTIIDLSIMAGMFLQPVPPC